MWPVSDRFVNSVRTSHKVALQVDLFSPKSEGWIPVHPVEGSVTLSASDIRGQLAMTIVDTDDLSPLLDITSCFFRVQRGLEYSDGSRELVPLGVFRMYARGPTSQAMRGRRHVSITASDYMRSVHDARFVMSRTYQSSSTKSLVSSVIFDALAGSVPTALDMVDTISDKSFASLFIDRERSELISRAELLLGADIYFDGLARLIMRPAASLDDAPVQWVSVGAGALHASESYSRDRMFNAAVVLGERTDGPGPVTSVVYDKNPLSPMYWGGPFGRVPKFYSSPLLVTPADCAKAGETMLKKRSGLSRSLDLEILPNPALEPGDVVKLYMEDGIRHIILDEFSIPLGPNVSMAAKVRVTDAEAVAMAATLGGSWGEVPGAL